MPTPSKPKVTANKPSKAKKAVAKTGQAAKRQWSSVESWDKKSSGRWTAGQASGLNPGDPRAISKYRHSQKFKARKKHVIRPRIQKQRHPDTKAK